MARSGWLVGLGAALALMGASAGAADKVPSSEANWARRPTNDEYSQVFGKLMTVGGFYRTLMHCAVGDRGELSGCSIVHETPGASGLGPALLSLAPKFRRKPPGPRDPRAVNVVYDWFSYDKQADWLRRPTPENLLAVFPIDAFRRGQDGRAIINCVITVQGALTDCFTLEETPAGSGFGSAAIALTPQFLLKPAQYHGAPIVSVLTVPINFITGGPHETVGAKRVVPGDLPWAEAPSYADVAAAYPRKAREEKLAGRATLACDLTEAGRLSGCNIPTIEPRGQGFDVAAKALSKKFRFEVGTDADRKATHGLEIHLTMVFDPSMLATGAPLIGKPKWASLPNAGQLQSIFAGLGLTSTARATLECVVQPGGGVGDCKVAAEEPAGKGVGAMVLSLAPSFRLTTWTAEGLPTVGGTIRIPLRYEPGAAANPTPTPPPK